LLNAGHFDATQAREAGRELKGARIGVLGYAYLEDSDDTRSSPSEALVRILRTEGAEPVIHDPWIEEYAGDVLERVKGCDAAVLMVAHSVYVGLASGGLQKPLRGAILVDGRGVLDAAQVREAGLSHVGLGQGTGLSRISAK
jgi:UDP-N-acetyl-D-mannosaminuronic acid dehydrogenase